MTVKQAKKCVSKAKTTKQVKACVRLLEPPVCPSCGRRPGEAHGLRRRCVLS